MVVVPLEDLVYRGANRVHVAAILPPWRIGVKEARGVGLRRRRLNTYAPTAPAHQPPID